MRLGSFMLSLAFSVALCSVASAGPASFPAATVSTTVSGASLIVPVVVFGRDARRLPEAFAREHELDPQDVTRAHLASGLIRCGNAHGAGQLTLSDDVITTAAHVFYDENGLPRARSCSFIATINDRDIRVPIDFDSIVAGSTNPYNVAPADDWAVARLVRPLIGVRPYGIAATVREEEPITFVARGHIDWGDAKDLSMQDCVLHRQLSESQASATREFSFDCDTGDGASGGALMVDRDTSRIGAILVGWRSNHPFSAMPYSDRHYNFAVTLEGAFRRAVYAASGKLLVQK
jgi:hypothetical protein